MPHVSPQLLGQLRSSHVGVFTFKPYAQHTVKLNNVPWNDLPWNNVPWNNVPWNSERNQDCKESRRECNKNTSKKTPGHLDIWMSSILRQTPYSSNVIICANYNRIEHVLYIINNIYSGGCGVSCLFKTKYMYELC